MTAQPNMPAQGKALSADDSAKLADLLLQLAGRGAGRMLSARRHVAILVEAYPLLDNSRQIIARRRIASLEARWGRLREAPENLNGEEVEGDLSNGLSPVMRVARWLSKRRYPDRYLRILHRAAICFQSGETCLSEAQEFAFAEELDGAVPDVGLSSFTEWMIELRIARKNGGRTYAPGDLCEWWVNEMTPTRAEDTAYAACLLLTVEIGVASRRARRYRGA